MASLFLSDEEINKRKAGAEADNKTKEMAGKINYVVSSIFQNEN